MKKLVMYPIMALVLSFVFSCVSCVFFVSMDSRLDTDLTAGYVFEPKVQLSYAFSLLSLLLLIISLILLVIIVLKKHKNLNLSKLFICAFIVSVAVTVCVTAFGYDYDEVSSSTYDSEFVELPNEYASYFPYYSKMSDKCGDRDWFLYSYQTHKLPFEKYIYVHNILSKSGGMPEYEVEYFKTINPIVLGQFINNNDLSFVEKIEYKGKTFNVYANLETTKLVAFTPFEYFSVRLFQFNSIDEVNTKQLVKDAYDIYLKAK